MLQMVQSKHKQTPIQDTQIKYIKERNGQNTTIYVPYQAPADIQKLNKSDGVGRKYRVATK